MLPAGSFWLANCMHTCVSTCTCTLRLCQRVPVSYLLLILGNLTSLLAKVMCLCHNYRCVCIITYLCNYNIQCRTERISWCFGPEIWNEIEKGWCSDGKENEMIWSFLQRSTSGSAAMDIEPSRSAPGLYNMWCHYRFVLFACFSWRNWEDRSPCTDFD